MRMEGKKLLKDLLSPGAQILGAEAYRKTAILIPLIEEEEPKVLLTKRSDQIPQGSEICFPGGRLDPKLDTNLQDTALRETEEEVGIPKGAYQELMPLGYYLAPFGIIVDCYIGILSTLPTLALNPQEVAEAFTISLQALNQAQPQKYHLKMEIHPYENSPQLGVCRI
jgi:coenzyme A diphosphatase NUDT7